jgi:hypothetical protein
MTESRSLLRTAFAWWMRQRWLVRAPIWLFRVRLGFMFGSRLLMLEHTGRNTGVRRYVVVEVVGRPRPGTYIVPAIPRAQRHPRMWAAMSPVFEEVVGCPLADAPMFALELRRQA